MDDKKGPTDEPDLAGGQVVEILAAVAAGGILVSANSPSAIMLASTLPVIAKTAFELDRRAWQRRLLRGGVTLESAAHKLEVSVDDLALIASESDARTELLGRVLEAAASTATLEEKVHALGRVLANGLRDDAKIDEALIMVAILNDLEAVHARALRALAERAKDKTARDKGWSDDSDLHTFTGQWIQDLPVMSVLTHHRLCDEEAYQFEDTNIPIPIWKITSLGEQVVRLLGTRPPKD